MAPIGRPSDRGHAALRPSPPGRPGRRREDRLVKSQAGHPVHSVPGRQDRQKWCNRLIFRERPTRRGRKERWRTPRIRADDPRTGFTQGVLPCRPVLCNASAMSSIPRRRPDRSATRARLPAVATLQHGLSGAGAVVPVQLMERVETLRVELGQTYQPAGDEEESWVDTRGPGAAGGGRLRGGGAVRAVRDPGGAALGGGPRRRGGRAGGAAAEGPAPDRGAAARSPRGQRWLRQRWAELAQELKRQRQRRSRRVAAAAAGRPRRPAARGFRAVAVAGPAVRREAPRKQAQKRRDSFDERMEDLQLFDGREQRAAVQGFGVFFTAEHRRLTRYIRAA